MIGISLRFPAGRYHATPWGRHVNEGVPEWPPSPWRFLRSLVAVWKRTLPDMPQGQAEPILHALAEPPGFVLPPASTGHTRHFMPWFKKGPDDRTLVFDTFVALDPRADVDLLWPDASLDADGRATLARVLANLNFLGRAESWCDARLLDAAEAARRHAGVNCSSASGSTPEGREAVRVLCADPEQAFRNGAFFVTSRTRHGKKSVESQQRSVEYDPDWLLCAETLWLHNRGWSDPPGSRWARYARPINCFEVKATARRHVARRHPAPQVVRFALDSNILPLVTDTLPIAEAARRALMSLHGRSTERHGVRGRSEVLSGKDAEGNPLSDHGHAYYLPTDEDVDGRIDRLTVIALGGLGPDELRAMDRLREIRIVSRESNSQPLRAILLGYGRVAEFSPPPVGPARTWVSTTPYIAARYARTRGRERIDLRSLDERAAFLTTDLQNQIRVVRPDLAGIIEQVVIEPLVAGGAVKIASRWRPIQFKRFRQKVGDDGARRLTGAFRLRFPHEVRGPIALGHSSHFGMGLFLPAGDTS